MSCARCVDHWGGCPCDPRRPSCIANWTQDDPRLLAWQEGRTLVQRMQIAGISTCSHYGRVVLEDPDGIVQLHIRMRPMMAHWLAHELKECHCPAISMYRLIQELLVKLGGVLRVAMIDASEDKIPLGLLIIRRDHEEEIQQSCHPVDAIALAARTQVPLYATSRALKLGSWKSIQPWLETVTPQDFR
jgi:bifunctional DNase/RNase